jgi:hypothetical protein
MLENPRNKEFDVYVLDQVFPEDEHSEFLKLIRELNGDWKKRIDDLDVFWFDWEEEHRGRKYLMRLLDIAKDYFDLSSAIGYETWIRMNTRPRDWHRDHDDRLEMTTGELKYPICTTCYYPYVADNVKDGRLCFENGTIVLPKTNRMVFFGPDVYHNVEPFTGERISILLNPWNETLCQTPCHDPWRRYMV